MSPLVIAPAADLPAALQPAVEALLRGELVIFPTETCYGIGARADNPAAIQRIYAAKQRPAGKPFAYHLGDWAMFNSVVGATTIDILCRLQSHWPGPITFLLDVAEIKTGFRFPSDPVAQAFLQACGVPVVATSANLSGEPSPFDAAMTRGVAPHAAVVIDAGPTTLRGDSTIVDLTVNPPVCVRRGVAPWPCDH
ncbi:MAG: L-threonylcarbamoyladenylate synthase [bacterium]|nr:L-threonylcarbamoyladenylate synthase [bacterium]